MTLRIRRFALTNFRKFRDPLVIGGLTDGLNIIIEPNETGKSTLLDALRAAFFVRHATKNQLAQSFATHGDAVAPSIEVAFEACGGNWTVAKRFLRSPMIEVNGPRGRSQGDAAEATLQELLGSVRDTSQQGNPASYGALGLLWVAQADALSVTPPNELVRNNVRSILESEVGTIMGGAAFEHVRSQIEAQYSAYWTPKGRPTGRLEAARQHVEAAQEAARDAAARLDALDRTFSELEAALARQKVLERELADESDVHQRAELVRQLEVARTAAQVLATRRAEVEAANAQVRGLQDLKTRHDAARKACADAKTKLASARNARSGLTEELNAAKARLAAAREALAAARDARKQARDAHEAGQRQLDLQQRQGAVAGARKRYTELLKLEAARSAAKSQADRLIAPSVMADLEANDRAIAEARAGVHAGATRIELIGAADGITIDGMPLASGERVITSDTHIGLGPKRELVIRPPASTASAVARLAHAEDQQRVALAAIGVEDVAAARKRNEAARDAAAEVRTLDARIAGATPADSLLELGAGPEALKAFIAALPPEVGPSEPTTPIQPLLEAMQTAEDKLSSAEGAHEGAIEALRSTESQDLPLAAAEAAAERDLQNAEAQLAVIESRPEFGGLEGALTAAAQVAASAASDLLTAESNATAHDIGAITRQIDTIDKRAKAASESRSELRTEIARLEAIIEIEGGKGLADRAAAAREEAEAAVAAYQRVTEEAETLKMLMQTLDDAKLEMSRSFAGPVARRARQHVERLLPGCDLTFSDELGLEAIVRAGVTEQCENLSRGTQEQLAILTRIAFADMLLEQDCPVSLILDDPLVYSDDARLDAMTDILLQTSARMQVILLTCRDRAFRHLPANRVRLGSNIAGDRGSVRPEREMALS